MRPLLPWVVGLLLVAVCRADEPPEAPWIDRLEPFGAAQGETLEVRIVGRELSGADGIEFDTEAIVWEETLSTEPDELVGRVRVLQGAPLGAHIVGLRAANGRSNSRLFYVDALPSGTEAEPNDTISDAQPIELRSQVLHGGLPSLKDRDVYRFEANEGERWTFDVRSIEYGGFLESELSLLDSEGNLVTFSDDRNDYLETPRLTHTFESAGVFHLLVDQYRGPQRVNCGENCGYMLRISQTPQLEAISPLGARRGVDVQMSLRGENLDGLRSVWLTPARNAEHHRLTFPHTMPVRAAPDSPEGSRTEAKILSRGASETVVEFKIPAESPVGLWRVWVENDNGPADGPSFVVDDLPFVSEKEIVRGVLKEWPLAINGSLDGNGEEDVYTVRAKSGQPLHFSVLAVQLGLPSIDPVLELFDREGALLAEHDDLMTGQGTVIGNPDASLYWTPEEDAPVRLHVRDRIGRGGPSFSYRLVIEAETPGFELITDAENPSVKQGTDSSLGVLLIRDPGFDQAVEVWAEHAHSDIEVGTGRFRADQFFGPSGDGDNVVIPHVLLDVSAEADAPAGPRQLRIFGKSEDGEVREAISTLWIGPPRKRNDVRRPLPVVELTVLAH